jgi:plasmid stabilization system protein ParE
MSRSLAFRPAAALEYEDAAAWYETQQPGLGSEFVAQVESVLDTIVRQPDRYPLATRTTREAPVARFPYCVYYRVHSNRIVITAVFHNSRNPAVWRNRR